MSVVHITVVHITVVHSVSRVGTPGSRMMYTCVRKG